MNGFHIIISKFLHNSDAEIKTNYNNHYLLEQFNIKFDRTQDCYIENYVSHKFNILKKNILESYFFNTNLKEYYFTIFNKSQKIYNFFCSIIRKFKIKIAKKFDNDNLDLCLNDISSFSKNSIISIYIDSCKTIYTFRISDLIQIINSALTYSPSFFAQP